MTGSADVTAADRRNWAEGNLSFDASRRRIAEASQWLAGGVSSNFRLGIQPTPLVFERADGAYLFDADGKAAISAFSLAIQLPTVARTSMEDRSTEGDQASSAAK